MKTLTKSQLMALLSSRKGALICSIKYLVDARLRKTGNPYGQVNKLNHVVIQTNVNYRRKLAKAIADSGGNPTNVEIHQRTWGEHIEGTPFIKHTTKDGELKHYLNGVVIRTISQKFLDTQNREIEKSSIEKFLPNKSSSPVNVATIELGHIGSIKVGGEEYVII